MNTEISSHVFGVIEDSAFHHDMQFRVPQANIAYCRKASVTEVAADRQPVQAKHHEVDRD